MHIVFLTHYYPPEVGAPQARLSELGRVLLSCGHQVTVLTGFPNYPAGIIPPQYRGKRFMEESQAGIRILRSWVYARPNRGILSRLMNHLSFTFSSALFGGRAGRPDLVLVESPPLFLGLTGIWLCARWRVPMVFNVADLWPESAIALGVLHNRFLIRAGEALERFIYSHSTHITVVTQGIRDILVGRGIPAKKVSVITNGVSSELFTPAPPDRELLGRYGVADKFVVLYAGTLGLSHGLESVLAAAALLRDQPRFHFLFAGDGSERELLLQQASNLGLANVTFTGIVPRDLMPRLVSSADACIAHLKRNPLFEGALPSKMFEYMSCGRPVILGVAGEASRLLGEAGAGICVAPEDPGALAAAVIELANNPGRAAALGEAGRRYVLANLDRRAIAGQYQALFQQLVEAGASGAGRGSGRSKTEAEKIG